MTSLAIKTRHGPVRVQNKPRQLNSQTLNSVKGKTEHNFEFERVNQFSAGASGQVNQFTSDAANIYDHNHHKLVDNNSYNMSGQLTIQDIELRTHVLKLLEDLESNINNDNFGKSTNELIANVCNYLKEHASYLYEDLSFKEQMDVYFNLLRNILRSPKLNRISRALILEVIELRAANWVYDQQIDSYYRKKICEFESIDSYSPLSEMNRGLQTSQSSGSIICSSIGNDVVKSSGKFVKPTKVPGKTFLKDEVVIRNSDSGKVMGIKGRRVHMIEEMSDTVISFQRVNPGAKERLVQITGPTEENIERAKELIESTIKRNASPVPFECQTKSFDSSLDEINNEMIDTEMFETSNNENIENLSTESDKKMPYSFTVNIADEVIQLSTKNYSIGHKAKRMLEEFFNSFNKQLKVEEKYEASDSNSDDDTIAANKEMPNKINPIVESIKRDVGFSLQRQSSATKIESFGDKSNQLQRSSSQGNVPIGRTSLRYLNTKVHEVPERVDNRSNMITYDRDFLMSCAKSPLSQKMPNIISKIASKMPDIVRNNCQKFDSCDANANQSASTFSENISNQKSVYQQW